MNASDYWYFDSSSQSGGSSFGAAVANQYYGGGLNVYCWISSIECVKNGGDGTYNSGLISFNVGI
ncbi:MAG: hypothetical protein R2822_12260 [Spirosomataceae bacterium]